MKTFKFFPIFIFIALLFGACEFDNFNEPEIGLTGKLKFEEQFLNTRQNVLFRLYQYKEDGYLAANERPIEIRVDQEGKYNALLFPGRYKMTVNPESGVNYVHKWKDFPTNESGELDTLYFDISKNKTLDFEVIPYYKIKDFEAKFERDSVVAHFNIEKLTVIDDNRITGFRNVSLFLSPTMHVNNDTPVSFAKRVSDVKPGQDIEIVAPLNTYYSNSFYKNNFRTYVYVRLGISLRVSAQEFIYSKVIKVEGIPQETINKYK
ncbi:MAG: DUF3823 domain-containing protein [Dysgonamonadaceae bacterium]|jgi:hypothetical protein|nr:DUF3823 domain-containing protein [Dysgonamonadaceae bacterium]